MIDESITQLRGRLVGGREGVFVEIGVEVLVLSIGISVLGSRCGMPNFFVSHATFLFASRLTPHKECEYFELCCL